MAEKRIAWIDFCRVYTAFCVIVRHGDRHYGSLTYIADLFNYRSLVFFFFLMAGYFTRYAPPGQLLDKARACRLLWPYLFWTLIAALTMEPLMHLGQIAQGDWSWVSFSLLLREMGLHSWCYWDYSNVPMWFLRTLIILALVSPLLQKLPLKAMLCFILFIFAASDVLCEADGETAAHYRRSGWWLLPFRLYESVLALGFYSAGLLLRRYATAEQLTSFVRQYAWLPLLGSLVLLPVVYTTGFYPPVQSSALVLLGVCTILSIGSLCEQYFPRFCRAVAKWGPATFFIYSTHFMLLHCLRLALTGDYSGRFTPLQDLWTPWLVLAISLALYSVLVRCCPRVMHLLALSPPCSASSKAPARPTPV